MLNHIWSLFTKAGSLWVAWIETTWLKGKSLWQISIPKNCSRSWKKLLKLRDVAKPFLSFKVGDGLNIFFWHDRWHPAGYLLDSFGTRAVYDLGLSLESKLSAIIRNGTWFSPYARSDTIVEMQSRLPEVKIEDANLPIWSSNNGVYSCAST
jgi:hypothetical protein